MQHQHHFLSLPDFNLSYYEWGDPKDQTILFIHATGMHARVWDATIGHLKNNYHIVAIDQRGHGASKASDYLLDWRMMGNDASFVIKALDLKNIIGVGHSMGGHVMAQAALANQDRFEKVILIDPVIFPRDRYETLSDFEKGFPKDNPIARRRNAFKNWQDMYEIFSKRAPYSDWKPEILENYCKFGVTEAADGSYSLACAPDIEASVYMGHCSVDLHDEMKNLSIPVTVLRARGRDPEAKHKIDFSASPTYDKLASCFPNGRDVWLKHLSHFIPMEDPEATAGYIEDTL